MREKPVLTSSYLIKLATATKVDAIAKCQCLVKNSISWWPKVDDDVRLPLGWLPGLEIPIIIEIW